eukprot:GHVT01038208.1.p1 GENE.GHVT01038208.1~~GHVT01038208.1.p1  ORF type:complete len:286 (+),score=31.36 GHVT01038208.1:967-1824(+)
MKHQKSPSWSSLANVTTSSSYSPEWQALRERPDHPGADLTGLEPLRPRRSTDQGGGQATNATKAAEVGAGLKGERRQEWSLPVSCAAVPAAGAFTVGQNSRAPPLDYADLPITIAASGWDLPTISQVVGQRRRSQQHFSSQLPPINADDFPDLLRAKQEKEANQAPPLLSCPGQPVKHPGRGMAAKEESLTDGGTEVPGPGPWSNSSLATSTPAPTSTSVHSLTSRDTWGATRPSEQHIASRYFPLKGKFTTELVGPSRDPRDRRSHGLRTSMEKSKVHDSLPPK